MDLILNEPIDICANNVDGTVKIIVSETDTPSSKVETTVSLALGDGIRICPAAIPIRSDVCEYPLRNVKFYDAHACSGSTCGVRVSTDDPEIFWKASVDDPTVYSFCHSSYSCLSEFEVTVCEDRGSTCDSQTGQG